MLALMDAIAAINAFMDTGGPILMWIAALTFVMWTLIFERVWYFKGSLNGDVQTSNKHFYMFVTETNKEVGNTYEYDMALYEIRPRTFEGEEGNEITVDWLYIK